MLGTLSLIAIVVCGAFKVTPFVLPFFVIINSFIGLHYPPGKAEMLRELGTYWKVFWGALPLHAVLSAVLYLVPYGIRILVG